MPRIIDFGANAARAISEGGASYLGTRRTLQNDREERERRDRTELAEAERRERLDAQAQAESEARTGQYNANTRRLDAEARGEDAEARILGAVRGGRFDPDARAMKYAQENLQPEELDQIQRLPPGIRKRVIGELDKRAQQVAEDEERDDLIGEIQRGAQGDEANPPLYSPEVAQQLAQNIVFGYLSLGEAKQYHGQAKLKAAKEQASKALGEQNIGWAQARLADPEVLQGLSSKSGRREAIEMMIAYQQEARLNPGKVDHDKFRADFELATAGPAAQEKVRGLLERANAAEMALFALGIAPDDIEGLTDGSLELTSPPTGAPSRAGLPVQESEPSDTLFGTPQTGSAAPVEFAKAKPAAKKAVSAAILQAIETMPDDTPDEEVAAALEAIAQEHGVQADIGQIMDEIVPKARSVTEPQPDSHDRLRQGRERNSGRLRL